MTAITVVGAGTVGTNLAVRFADLGHQVRFAVRDPESPKARAALAAVAGATALPLSEATDGAAIVVIATPYDAIAGVLERLGGLDGRIVVDVTNAVGRDLPHGAASVPEVIVAARADATVVKAFNTIGAEAFLDPHIGGRPAFLPIAGPADAAETVRALAAELGFDAHVLGDLDTAVLLESHARLWMHLAFRAGLGRGIGFALLRPDQQPPEDQP